MVEASRDAGPSCVMTSAVAVLIFTAMAVFGAVPAAFAGCLQPESDRPTVGLVLGGGGARGSAHIGVIRVLEEIEDTGRLCGGDEHRVTGGCSADELERVMLDID